MNVGLTLYGRLDERSGGFRYDRRLVEGLRAAGDDVEVIELPWRAYPRGLLDNASRRWRSRLEADVDVMLQDELAHPSLVRTNRRLDYPIVSVVDHLRSSERRRLSGLYRRIETRYLATVDGAICNSRATRDTVLETGSIAPEQTVVAPPGGDRFDPEITPAEIRTRAERGRLRLVFVGNVTPRKGLTTLVSGLAEVDADWDLTVVGRPVNRRYDRRARRLAREAGVEDRVTFAGETPDEELATILRAGHALAVPSRYEGFGIVYLEAMSFGLPVVATTAGGATEIVDHGETGFLVEPDDSGAVADAVRSFVDRSWLAEMGVAARRRYERHPGWDESVGRIRNHLKDVVTGQARRCS